MGKLPHGEYPRPQMRREDWVCLNGTWDLCKRKPDGSVTDWQKILVPFSPETVNSGVAEGFVLEVGEELIYQRSFEADASLLRGVTLLHFGAVDSECKVFLNGKSVSSHVGGFTAFVCDVSDVIRPGQNELRVECRDEATRNSGARGKQSDQRGGIWYTPQSGIWQTVWLESMPRAYIRDLKIVPDAQEKRVEIFAQSDGEEIELTLFDGEREILSTSFVGHVTLSHDFELWSPEHPKLYDFTLKTRSGDLVRSYFGVRSFGKTTDKNGRARLTLNGKPYFFNGVLDQGYWSDGMLTYPSDEAAIEELERLKAMGFNTLRKHIKIEPMRWYYHCDRLGLVVWQDFVNGGGEYSFAHVAALPFLGFHHKDHDYKYFAREDARGREEFWTSVDETLSQLGNCVSIGVWVPFNEGWGQFDSASVTEHIRKTDPTRIIDSVSGWHDQGVGKTELRSLHTYYTKLKVPKDTRPVVLSEFGGYSMKIDGHVFDEEKEFGYKKFRDANALLGAVRTLYLKKLKPLIAKGLCGCIYTQVSDVEEEINGLWTYDREIVKLPIEEMKKINDEIAAEAEKVE
ncbi:MAG: glycoside hydrolase family 2 [Clostridia bacterium]|nr:glycoside hydrolase family 2 [Clostridia bacterium]